MLVQSSFYTDSLHNTGSWDTKSTTCNSCSHTEPVLLKYKYFLLFTQNAEYTKFSSRPNTLHNCVIINQSFSNKPATGELFCFEAMDANKGKRVRLCFISSSTLKKQHAQFWINAFQDLKDSDYFSGDFLDKSLIQFTCLEITEVRHLWLYCFKILVKVVLCYFMLFLSIVPYAIMLWHAVVEKVLKSFTKVKHCKNTLLQIKVLCKSMYI